MAAGRSWTAIRSSKLTCQYTPLLNRPVSSSEISVTEMITETEIIDPTLTETEMMVILKMEIL